MNYTKKLQDIGFSEEEAKIYLAVLKLGIAKVSDISRETNVARTSVYNHLSQLLEKNYLKKTKNQGAKYLIANEPKIILDNQEEKIENFSKILPMLEKLAGLPEKKPTVEFSDVRQGLLNINDAILKAGNKKNPVYVIESGSAVGAYVDIVGWKFIYQL